MPFVYNGGFIKAEKVKPLKKERLMSINVKNFCLPDVISKKMKIPAIG